MLVVALAARLSVVAWAHGRFPPTADGSYYHVLAQRLAEGHGYTWAWPDGVVTFAAHYPIGYPAALAAFYALLGASPTVAMVLNALVGAIGCLAVQRLLAAHHGRRVSLLAGLAAALHPGLVAYTPALMTEGVAASLVACAAWATSAARRCWSAPVGVGRYRRWSALGVLGCLIGIATLVRPQCLLLAPLLGALALGRSSLVRLAAAALLVTSVALAVCAPWTARNCARMDRCALVSVNGGWNLLIGTDPRGRGGWAPLVVPPACRTVFDEAGKDRCFERAAWRRIKADPGGWLSLIPAKLGVTLDYCGAAGWYLHEANADAFSVRAKQVLGAVETVVERVLLMLALLACWPGGPPRTRKAARFTRLAVLALGLAAACWVSATPAFLALLVLGSWRRPRLSQASTVFGASLAAVLTLLLVHAVFFGSGRYQLLVWPLLCGLAALGWSRAGRILRTVRP